MLKFRTGAGAVIAADTQNAVASVDDALLNGVRLYASVLETVKGSNLPAGQSQQLYSTITASLDQILSGRNNLVSTVRQLTRIKGRSNFAPEDYGCPAGWAPLGANLTEDIEA
jgi:hypothetical protein